MPRKAPEITVDEKAGDKFPSLEAVQRAAIDELSQHLANTIRDLIESGRLVICNGKIIPCPKGDT
jgi:hypothetical protein